MRAFLILSHLICLLIRQFQRLDHKSEFGTFELGEREKGSDPLEIHHIWG
jgi:hypothetical protein